MDSEEELKKTICWKGEVKFCFFCGVCFDCWLFIDLFIAAFDPAVSLLNVDGSQEFTTFS